MQPRSPYEADYHFLTASGSAVRVWLAIDEKGQPELQVFGNRAGLLSFANVLLWLVANASRREFLALAELPFMQLEAPLAVCLRMTDADATGRDGALIRTDRGEQFEWSISEDDLQRVATLIHRLASKPGHEYDRLLLAERSAAGVHIRMTDAAEWLIVRHAEQGRCT
jgi:hypothetical protein